MPKSLTEFDNLVPNVAENFFNDQEQNLVGYIQFYGPGYYKITEMKTGAFIGIQRATEVTEDDYLVEGSLVSVIGPNDVNWHYANFICTPKSE